MRQILRFILNNYMELNRTVSAYFMAIYLFLQLLRFMCNNIKPIDKLSRRQFMNSFNATDVLG